jgi:hypothetical protein
MIKKHTKTRLFAAACCIAIFVYFWLVGWAITGKWFFLPEGAWRLFMVVVIPAWAFSIYISPLIFDFPSGDDE